MTLIGRIARTAALLAAPRITRNLNHLRALRQAPTTPAPAPTAAATVTPIAEIPTLDEIQAAARLHDQAREQANAAARTKRHAEKTLKAIPDGTYGTVTIERVPSSRQTADLDAVRRIFAEQGLGEVPMKTCAPSLTITWADDVDADQPVLAAA